MPNPSFNSFSTDDFTTSGNVIKVKIPQASRVFVSKGGSDATGLRGRLDKPFLTLAAAKAAATAGDTIFVAPGTYAENNLLKDGVNWHFDAGAIVSFTDPGSGTGYGIFDDRASGAATCKITGDGVFLWSGGIIGDTSNFDFRGNVNCLGTIVVTSPDTSIQLECAEIGGTSYDFNSRNQAIVYVLKCLFFDLKVKRIYDPVQDTPQSFEAEDVPFDILSGLAGIFWGAGEMHVQCDELIVLGHIYGVWCGEANIGYASSFWYTGNLIKGGKVYISGLSASWRTWFNVKWIDGGTYDAYNVLGGGKHYLTAQKLSSDSNAQVISNSASGATSGANEVWLSVEKITGPTQWIHNGATSGAGSPVTYAEVLHFEDSSAVTNGVFIGSGILYLNTAFIKTTNGNAIKFDGGKAYIKNCIIDTTGTNAVGNRPVEVTANGLHLMNSVLIAPALADSIYAGTAKNVGILGSVMANKAKNANITTTPLGSFTVDSAVQ